MEPNESDIVKEAMENREFKLLNRDEAKEMKALREILNDLSAFQIRFVEQYIRTASASQAARLAGSKSATPETIGYKLLQDPRIQKAIAIAMKKRIEAVGLDTVEVIMKIREVYDAAMESGKFNEANRACELLQKEIDRASKAPEGLTKQGKIIAKLEEGGGNVDHELSKVLEIVQNIRAS
jgi:hypothetical protein